MANSDFFSNMMGFSTKYTTESSKSQFNDETDYEDVDFCKGEEVEDKQNFLFEGDDALYGISSNAEDSIFNFEQNSNDDIG